MCGVSSLGLSTKVLPAARHGRDLPRHLQERVVPRRDQAADADGLVHDPADHVGVAGVDDPAGLLGGDAAVVAEDRDDVGDVVLALDEAACRCRATPSGRSSSVSRSSRSATRSSRSPRSRLGRGRPRRRRGRRGAPRRSRPRCPRRRPRRPRRPGCRRPGSGSRAAHRRARCAHAPSTYSSGTRTTLGVDLLRMSQPDAPSATSQTFEDAAATRRSSRAGRGPRVDLAVTPAEPVRDLAGGLDDQARRPRRPGRGSSRNVGPETLIDATTSPWALRIGAATAVSPTSSSSIATRSPARGPGPAPRAARARLVIVWAVYVASVPSTGVELARRRGRSSSTLPLLVACSGMCWPTQLCGCSADEPATWSR